MLSTVTLTWNFTNSVQAGEPVFVQVRTTAGGPVANAAGETIIDDLPVSAGGAGASGSLAGIVPCDTAGLQPAGWGYAVKAVKRDGTTVYDETVIINYAAGAVQDLSSLNPATPVTQYGVTLLSARNLADVGSPAAALANLGGFPLTQEVTSAASEFQSLFSVQSAGGTDPVGPFGLAGGGLDIDGILGHAYFLGYNALQLASGSAGANGAIGASFFLDAGDTSVNGAHGLEANWGCFLTPDASHATNAFTTVAVNDNSNTVNTTIRCGTGTEGASSFIAFQKSDNSVTFAIMSVATGQTSFLAPVTFPGGIAGPLSVSVPGVMATSFTSTGSSAVVSVQAEGTGSPAIFQVSSATGTATLEISGNNASTADSALDFMASGVMKWQLAHNDPYLYVNSSINTQMLLAPGASYNAATTYMLSQVAFYDNVVINNGGAALAVSATHGFLYIPTCAGVPTGTPQPNAGSVPVVYNTSSGVLYAYTGGAWAASGGSGGGVTSVAAGDTSIVVGGTGAAPTIKTATLDVIASDHPPAANWSNNSQKITSLANGTAAQDAAAFGQIPTALPPSGPAGGALTGTYPNPGLATVTPGGGGTGATSAAAGYNALSPMSTLGDLEYESAANTAARLPGNTSTTPKVLTQAGNGTVSAAPAWSPIIYGGVFGDGTDGAATLDGTAAVVWATKAGSVYTMTRSAHLTSLTVSSGVTLACSGSTIFCQGTITNNGTIQASGIAASGTTAGTASGSGANGGGRPGGASSTGAGAAGSAGLGTTFGTPGAGGTGTGGSGGAAGTTTGLPGSWYRTPYPVLTGIFQAFAGSVVMEGAAGGGAGGGDGTNKGGGGGGGGGIVPVLAWAVINNGTISAAGGAGGTPPAGNCGGGGGGGGGAIIIYTLAAWTAGTTSVSGGAAGSAAGTGTAGSAGAAGSVLNVIVQ